MFSIPEFIERPHYTEKVKPFVGKQILKILTGQRRVGKSYLLFQMMQHIIDTDQDASILYINKEDLKFSFIKTAEDLNEYVLSNRSENRKTYVFIDEIQDIENFETALRSLLLDEYLDVYCTGSNANLLSGDIAGYLSGRCIEITVYSLSYTEFLQFHHLENNHKSLDFYMKYGGLPYLIHLPLVDAVVFEYLKNIYSAIVYRDIINRYAIRNVAFFGTAGVVFGTKYWKHFFCKKISDFLKSQKINMAPNQVQVYVHYLTSAFLLHQVTRYDMVGKRMFEIGDKYYFENLGIETEFGVTDSKIVVK